MTKNHTQLKPVYFKHRALVLAVRRALPFLVAFSLGAALVGPAAGRSGENAAAFTATQLIRQFTLKNTVAQVSQGMQGHVQEVNGFLRAPAMGVRPSGFPADMGSVPGTVNLPRRDGAGRPLGYCAWDNASASSDANHLAGSGVPNPLAYAVISPGLNGTMETTCANVLATGTGQGDDFVQVTAPAQASSKQFRSAVGTVAELLATPAEEGDVRLVAENNKLYSYLGGIWVPVDGSKFADDSVANGAGALAYIAGKVTVADFQAASATITGALAGDSATFTNGVTAATFTGNGSGLTDLNAGNINSGILGAAFGGTGVDGSVAAQGSLLIGTGAGFALGAITAGDGIGVLNGAGSITISNTGVLSITGTADQIIASGSNGDVVLSLPQSIATTSTPTFAGLMLNGALMAPSATFSGDISARRLYLSDSTGGVTTPNLIIGLGAMAAATSGEGANTAVGIGALGANTTGDKNTAIGEGALNANLTGNLNTALGHSALRDSTTGSLNTALGSSALRFNISGSNNTAVGDGSLYNNLTGYLNTAVGRASMISNIDGYNNSALGEAALYYNTSGYDNVAVGKHTLFGNTTGYENTALGVEALWHNTTGIGNVALGRHAGFYSETGSNNTFLGTSAIPLAANLNYATAIGAQAEVSTSNTIVLGRVTDKTVIGATGDDGSDNLLQVTGNAGVSGDLVLTQSGAGSTLGSKIRFGGVNEETDPISLGRINASGDNSILQLTLGDNEGEDFGSNGDRFQIATSNGFVRHTFDSNGNAYHAGTLTVGALNTSRLNIGSYDGILHPNLVIGNGALLAAQSGDGGNLVLGEHVMESNSTGAYNTALGIYAMHFNGTGSYNTAVGFEALQGNSTGNSNVALGVWAMHFNTTGYDNTAVGFDALAFNTTGFSNVVLGKNAMRGNTTGWENIAIGQDALYTNEAGAGNLAIGYESLKFLNSGSSNIGIGYDALENLQSGSRNVAIGNEAGERDGTRTLSFGSDNTFLGAYTGPAAGVNTLNFGTAIGAYAEVSTDNTIVLGRTTDTTVIGATGVASSGVLLGKKLQVTGDVGITGNLEIGGTFTAASATFTGGLGAARLDVGSSAGVLYPNTIVGLSAMTGAQSGDGANTAIGVSTLQNNTTGAYNTGLGSNALETNSTGSYNLALGLQALRYNTTGSENTAVGAQALNHNTSGGSNVALGAYSLYENTTGFSNLAFGKSAMHYNTTGWENIAIGQDALFTNTAGAGNLAFGYESLKFLNSGSSNIGIGYDALENLQSGSRNVAIGNEAGERDGTRTLSFGSDNTFLGAYTGPAAGVNTLNFATAIGAYAEVSTDNTIVLGRTTDTTVIGATGVASSGVLLGKKLQVTGDVGITGNLEIGGTFTAASATFTGGLGAARLDVGTSVGVTFRNTIVGIGSLDEVQTGAGGNVAMGSLTMTNNTTGWDNVAVGDQALWVNTTGYSNTALGDRALMANTTGYDNVGVGKFAMSDNTTGFYNVAVGNEALYSNITGSGNSAVGKSALWELDSGSENTAIGQFVLYDLVTGSRNVAVGSEAGSRDAAWTLTSGSDNTFLGAYSGPASGVNTLNFSTAIGAYAEVSTDNTVVLGRTTDTTVIGATGVASSGVLLGKKLQVTGDVGITGNIAVGGTFTAASATFTGAVAATRLDIASPQGVTYPNTIVGMGAMAGVQSGVGANVAVGIFALENNSSGDGNTAVGDWALRNNTTGTGNTALGDGAMHDNITGSLNVAVGQYALQSNTEGVGNSVVGHLSLFGLTTGSENTTLGNYALDSFTSGSRNVAIGSEAGSHFVLTSGSDNTFLGAYSGPASGYTTLNFATAIGAYAEVATENTIVLGRTIDNTVIGNIGDDGSGNKLQVSGSVGVSGTLSASRLNVGNYDGGVADINFAIGYEALAAAQSGDGGNMAIGEHTLEYNTTGSTNTAVGNYAMHWNETGIQNTALGYNALQDNVSGSSNTAVGRHAMFYNTSGSSNTAVGDDALAFNTAGNLNVAVGQYALYANGSTGIGFENTAVGYDAMERLTDGAENTSLGSFALNFLTTGSRNTVIGSEAASRDPAWYLTSGSDNTFLGAYSGPASGFNTLNFATAIGAYAQVSTNNTVVLGRTSDTVVIGATGNDASGNKLQVTGSIKATAFNTSSDRRLKNSITQLDSSNLLAQLQQLNAYHYRFNSDPTGQIRYGVIAQEVATLFPHAVSYDGQGLMAVDYGALGAIAATAVGQLSTQVTALDKQVKTNTANITTLTDRMGTAEGKIEALESWKTQAVDRMDNLQTAIDKNIADIAKNAVAITANTQRIDTLEEVTALLDARTTEHGSLITVLQAQWSDTFSRADDGQTLVVNAPNLKASNFSAQQASVGTLYSERLMAEMAKIKALEVDSLLVNSAQARTVRAEEMNTGSAQVYAGVGLPALLFAATADGHYTVSTSALDGSYATATVIVNAGQAKIVPVASEGIELVAEGNTVKAIAAGKSIKASWIKMG